MEEEKWEQAGECGVDTGLIWIGDPCYILGEDANQQPSKTWSEFCSTIDQEGPAQQYNYKNGDSGLGVLVKGFDGDGCYPVFVKTDKRGNVMEAKIVFSEVSE